MTPRLILLTGPAAGEVARVLRAACPAADPLQGQSCEPWWDEVRDYVSCLIHICYGPGAIQGRKVDLTTKQVEQGIRSLPGGEEWLVGLVLPEHQPCSFGGGQEYCAYRNALPLAPRWECAKCRKANGLPPRLAILAPDPPRLLVERVRQWGGEVWWCSTRVNRQIIICDSYVIEDTWPEAVRAALGEAL